MSRYLLFLIFAFSCSSRTEKEAALDEFVVGLPEIKPIFFSYEPTKEDPKIVSVADKTFQKTHFKDAAGVVGYSRYKDVTCIYTSYPGDDMYLFITTFVKGERVDSKSLEHGVGPGCEIDSFRELTMMVTPNTFLTTTELITQKCDSLNNDPIPGTAETQRATITTTIQDDGKITVTEKTRD